MKSAVNLGINRPGAVRIGLTIGYFLLAVALALADPSATKRPKLTPTPNPPQSSTPSTTPKPAATPSIALDPKTEAELLQAEERFINAIRNGDAKALGELLTDYYADSFGDAERALNKIGVAARLSAQKLPAYEVQKERKLSVSAGAFTVEGRARDVLQDRSEVKPKEEWFHVRRLWIKRDNQWLLYAQIITPEDEAKEEKEKELK